MLNLGVFGHFRADLGDFKNHSNSNYLNGSLEQKGAITYFFQNWEPLENNLPNLYVKEVFPNLFLFDA